MQFMPAIHEAAKRGDVEALGRELASGVSPNALDKSKLGLPARPARRVAEYAFHAGDY